MDWGPVLEGYLSILFGWLTASLAAVIGPTYDGLLVPELAPGSLYPGLPPFGPPGAFLATAAAMSEYVVVNLVDPAVVAVAAVVGLLYLARASLGRRAERVDAAVPKLVVGVILANFAVPIAGGVLGAAGATYPVVAGYDGGAWQHWVDLAGYGELGFVVQNGPLAFVVSFALFAVVLLLAILVALRDALLAVLLVVLPAFSLLLPIPRFDVLAKRAWLLFVELAFLPCVLVVPLELAVGAPNVLLLLGFLTVALGSPFLVSVAGAQLGALGAPSAGAALTGGVQLGLAAGASALGASVRPIGTVVASRGVAGAALADAGAALGRAPFPAGAPLAAAELVGHGAAHLFRHFRGTAGRPGGTPGLGFPAIDSPGSRKS